MKKRILSIFLATLLIAAMAIPASAAQYVSDGYSGSSYYEIVDNCYIDSFSCETFCADQIVQTVVAVKTDAGKEWTVYGPIQYGFSTASDSTVNAIVYIDIWHWVDNGVVRNNHMTPF